MTKLYTTQLQAGLALVDETAALLRLWQPGMKAVALNDCALKSGNFPNISARRLRNLVSECFAPRYLCSGDYPAEILKQLLDLYDQSQIKQLLFIFTARANTILYDFVCDVYWSLYANGRDSISNAVATQFVIQANQEGKTVHSWSEGTIRRVSAYLTGSCSEFGLLEKGQKVTRKIVPFRLDIKAALILAYDLHFSGLGDNSIVLHSDWHLFGLQSSEVKEIFQRLALSGYLIFQSAGAVTHISWSFKNWEEVIHAVAA